MAAIIEPLITVDDLELMPEDGNRYEVIEGELFVSRTPGLPHQRVLANTVANFWNYLLKNPIGEVIPTPGLIFGRFSGVIPDIVFYTHERARQIISGERLVAAPELVIEILSRGRDNIARDRVAKRELYAKYGVQEYWIMDAENRAIEIYRLKGDTLELDVILRHEDEITSPLLAGFKCIVATIFG
jgi:Uma2 family endonuclease